MPYVSPAWPTTDHVIPWKLFNLGYRQMYRVMAQHRLSQARAVSMGTLIAAPAASKTAAMKREKRVIADDRLDAYPETLEEEQE